MLYLVATPIGNLKDTTFRAVEILSNVDYILCEDTRHSRILLNHYNIKTSLVSFHQFSEASKEDRIINDLKARQNIALISDAGTPAISDPGERLVKRCREEGIPVSPIPGPSALVAALCASGLPTTPFQFVGFLPRKAGELQRKLMNILIYPGTTLCYESPKRVEKVLQLLAQLDRHRKVVIARELTKTFEEFRSDTAEHLLTGQPIKGECVLLISGLSKETLKHWDTLSPREYARELEKMFQINYKEAIKLAAQSLGIPSSFLKKGR